jgi:hypothetical protein
MSQVGTLEGKSDAFGGIFMGEAAWGVEKGGVKIL